MKKGIIVLLIAVLASSFAFATFSGSAGVIYNASFDDKSVGADNVNSLSFSFTFASEEIKLDSSEDAIHVEVAASAKFILGERIATGTKGVRVNNGDLGVGAILKLDTAKIVGKNWYVDITGTQGAYDYAKAEVLTIKTKEVKDAFGNFKKYDNEAASYVVPYDSLDGITVGFNDFTASLGFGYEKDLAFMVNATLETPEFAFNDDAVKVQAAAEFVRAKIGDATTYIGATTFGASAKATIAVQDITVDAAADFGLAYAGAEFGPITEKDTEVNFDARVGFKYSFVNAAIYTYAGQSGLSYGDYVEDGNNYASLRDFYLEAKAAFDLNAFELPLKVTVSAKNITNAESFSAEGLLVGKYGIVPAVKVEFAKDAITAAQNKNFRLALNRALDKATWNAVQVGDDLKLNSLRNMYTPYDFVSITDEVTFEGKTWEVGTNYGEIVQYYIEKEGLTNLDLHDSNNSWYNTTEANKYMEAAKAELEGKLENKSITIEIMYYSASPIQTAQAAAYKKSIEDAFGGFVKVNTIKATTLDDYYACGYRASTGADGNYNVFYGSGWGPDYGDPSTYLETFYGQGGYMAKTLGIYGY